MIERDRRRLVVLGVLLGALVAALVGKTLFGGSGEAPIARVGSGSTADPFTPSTAAPGATVPPTTPTFHVFGTKNPFEPVIQLDTTPTTGSGSGATTTIPTTTTGPTPDTTPITGPDDGTTPTTTAPPPGQPVTLVDVFRNASGTVRAHLKVGSTVYTVSEGDTFAGGRYRVVSLTPPCGQFLYGDAPFRLCQGEQTLK